MLEKNQWYLYISFINDNQDVKERKIKQVVGVSFKSRVLLTVYDSKGRTKRFTADDLNITSMLAGYGPNTLYVIEKFSNNISYKNLYHQTRDSVGIWSFIELKELLKYNVFLNQSLVLEIDSKCVSETCPKCGHTTSLNKKLKMFCCRTCNYISDKEEIKAMNLHRMGITHHAELTSKL
ncbi:zinc ribbon domain-containing protein [Bacillus wiedmannii]|uniref:zinc ribbon domain-containing protein n=1 Tax=Bacillus wiedmannii TaxID=1890302 RepID=UPI000B447642|nr:zinc ribbon domain-containing protein [Bacillus wiedmannii]OUB80907.1 hypothetical protein BK788_25045 [Bacillus thuringiensis serovar sinensis]